jgi:hypothetical protein
MSADGTAIGTCTAVPHSPGRFYISDAEREILRVWIKNGAPNN